MERIQLYWGVGSISSSGSIVQYQVRSIKDITKVIIPHFEKYPLQTQKQADYELLKRAILVLNKKEHFL